MILVFLMTVSFEPYIDYYKANGRYHIILWYSDLDGQRKYFNILGGN